MDSDSENENGAPDKMPSDDDVRPENVLNILLATDIHLGYAEKDPVRGEDSFVAFREILKLAKDHDVDMVLLGGDLFHDSRPSMTCLLKCMSLIREYCLGDRPISVEFLSEQDLNFSHCKNPIVNYEDPNFNISIPIFSIHGNHDDPSGFGSTCSLDILSASGLVNYFGKQQDLSHIRVSPLLLSKGTTQLALYGLSHVKDARLYRLFKAQKVQMFVPTEPGEWFSLLVLHQNRAEHTAKGSIPEEMLPEFLDMVFWGHEHGCRVEEEYNEKRQFYVTQPGSSVATSLSEDEAIPKKVAILKVHGKSFQLQPLPLRSVRPFVFDMLVLDDCKLPTQSVRPGDNVQRYVANHLELMLQKAKKLCNGDPLQPTLPLLRLRLLYSDEAQMFNTIRFGQDYVDRVANPGDMILQRRDGGFIKTEPGVIRVDRKAMDSAIKADEDRDMLDTRIETIVKEYFDAADVDSKLSVLSVPGLLEAILQFVEKDDKEAVDDIMTCQMKKSAAFLVERGINEENADELLVDFNTIRNPAAEVDEARQQLSLRSKKPGRARVDSDNEIAGASSGDEAAMPSTRGRGRGSRGPRAPRGRGRAAASTRGRGKQQSVADSFANVSRYDSVVSKQPTQRKGMRYSESDSD